MTGANHERYPESSGDRGSIVSSHQQLARDLQDQADALSAKWDSDMAEARQAVADVRAGLDVASERQRKSIYWSKVLVVLLFISLVCQIINLVLS